MGIIVNADGSRAVPCNGCTACCRWGSDITAHPPITMDEARALGLDEVVAMVDGSYVMPAKENGECVLLGPNGCTMWSLRPDSCKEFDCREMVRLMLDDEQDNPMLNIVIAAVKAGLEQ